jgi:hypothetical protein
MSSTSGLNFAAETLMFSGYEWGRSVSFGGSNRYSLTCFFDYKQTGWNKFYRALDNDFISMYLTLNNNVFKPFATKSFTNLLP